MPYIATIRQRRQITLPKKLLNQLVISQGDKLLMEVRDKKLIAKPAKEQAIDTLKAIQKAVLKTKVSEEELQKSGRKLRKKLVRQLYG